MVYEIADNIISPLGSGTELNYQKVKSGHTALRRYDYHWNLRESFVASLFTPEQNRSLCIEGLTRFESLAVKSVRDALSSVDINVRNGETILIISTTKGSVEAVDRYLGDSIGNIARALDITTTPVACCNACISGVSAIILAKRLLESGQYANAIVCGVECQSKFIVSGFQSLKALSDEPCRPFDIDRVGLNLGEAAATMILSVNKTETNRWHVCDGVIRNDAYHITNPSRTAEGSYRALQSVLKGNTKDGLSLINAHGTATLFNDQMESVAIERAGLSDVPVNALKGYYGHTMGAAGVLETILTMKSLDEGVILGTKGFREPGVSGKINIFAENRHANGSKFVKLISGFGGCNGAVLFSRNYSDNVAGVIPETTITHRVTITPEKVMVDGRQLKADSQGKQMLTEIYKNEVNDYPKFYKMDMLGRLGFIASELLLNAEGRQRFQVNESRAVVFCNHSSSIYSDRAYQHSIDNDDEFFPSPSVFVYTLPNIVTGEIAIRNRYYGETSFFVVPDHDSQTVDELLKMSFLDRGTSSVLGGWIDCNGEDDYEADVFIMEILNKR